MTWIFSFISCILTKVEYFLCSFHVLFDVYSYKIAKEKIPIIIFIIFIYFFYIDENGIFRLCESEFDSNYLPCNTYQALALSHLYEIDEHSYYWLWPGGNAGQGGNAVTKQDIGHNPVDGKDRCQDNHHVGFFHNWSDDHVDSWGCLPDSSPLSVLCCRRKQKQGGIKSTSTSTATQQ